MIDIAPETLTWLRQVFSNCGPFASDNDLAAVFVDARIAPLRDDLPEASSRIDRIDTLIEYLHASFIVDKAVENAPPQNALVLFTQVLADRTAPEDACYAQLQSVAQRLAEEINEQAISPRDIVVGRVPTISAITDAALLDELIANQRNAIRSYSGFAIGLVIFGLTVMTFGFTLPGVMIAAAIKPWIGLGGLFIVSLSVFQFKEVMSRKEKVGLFTTMKTRLSVMLHDPEYAVMHDRIDRMVWQFIEKAVE